MPLLQRIIEPVHVCRGTLPLDARGALAVSVPSELECVTNGTLANVVRQLSSLSKHADDLFGVLLRDAAQLVARTGALQARVDRLALKVTQLDSTVEEVSLQDIHMRKAFRSSIVYDQQVVSRASMPAGMLEMYQACDRPPPLDKLNPYREDGKDGLKFYTDPNYFFDLWRQEMLKDTERIMLDRGKKVVHSRDGAEPNRARPEGKRHKKVRQPHNTRERFRQIAKAHEFLDHTPAYGTTQPYAMRGGHQTPVGGQQQQMDGGPVRPSSLELGGPIDRASMSMGGANHVGGAPAQYPLPPPAYTEHPPPQSPPHHQQYAPPPPYVERVEQQHTPPMSVTSPANGGTPTRQNRLRPSQPPPAPPTGSSSSGTSTPSASGTPASGAGRHRAQRDTLPPPPPPPEALSNQVQDSNGDSVVDGPDALDLPPPPPTPEVTGEAPPPSRASTNGAMAPPPAVTAAPPPPPPPLPPPEEMTVMTNGTMANGTLDLESVSSGSSGKNSAKTTVPAVVKSNPAVFTDARSDLLAAIREGIKLRRVEDLKQKQVEKAAQPHDVASILARRVAIEVSDSDSGSGSEYDSDWDNETEC